MNATQWEAHSVTTAYLFFSSSVFPRCLLKSNQELRVALYKHPYWQAVFISSIIVIKQNVICTGVADAQRGPMYKSKMILISLWKRIWLFQSDFTSLLALG